MNKLKIGEIGTTAFDGKVAVTVKQVKPNVFEHSSPLKSIVTMVHDVST